MINTITIDTDSEMAWATLARIDVRRGKWFSDGRETTSPNDVGEGADIEFPGRGWRARFIGRNGDYGWGPLGKTAQQSVILLMAEFIEYDKPEWRDDWNDD